MRMGKPLISVVIPIYDVEDYLDRCLESVTAQTYRNLDIVLVDDGSPDDCPAMCDRWAERDTRIRVVHKPNGGLSSARNAGLDIASGDYVTFVDSDDWLERDAIETLWAWMEREGCDVVMGGTAKTFDDGTVVEVDSSLPARAYSSEEALDAFLYHRDDLTSAAWNKLFSAEFFRGNRALRFPEGLNSEDYVMLSRVYSRMRSLYCNPKSLYHYCVRDDSICTTTQISSHTYDKITVADNVCAYLRSTGFDDERAMAYFVMQANHDVLFDLVGKGADGATLARQRRALRHAALPVYRDSKVSAARKIKIFAFALMPRLYHRLAAGRPAKEEN